jgi:hypothetical protein
MKIAMRLLVLTLALTAAQNIAFSGPGRPPEGLPPVATTVTL